MPIRRRSLFVRPSFVLLVGFAALAASARITIAQSLNATHITQTDSGHGLPVEQPALVTEALLQVVNAAR